MDIETVEEHCKHKDCIYRCRLTSFCMDFCNYIMIAKEPRGCPVSQCNRYKKGKRKPAMTSDGLWFEWECIEENDAEIY